MEYDVYVFKLFPLQNNLNININTIYIIKFNNYFRSKLFPS